MAKGSTTSISTQTNTKIACVLWCLGLLFIVQQTIPRFTQSLVIAKRSRKTNFMEWN